MRHGLSMAQKQVRVMQLIHAFKTDGHLCANIDPLNICKEDPLRPPFMKSQLSRLQPETYGLCKNEDGNTKFWTDNELNPALSGDHHTLNEIIETLEKVYCGPVGLQFMHMTHEDSRKWLDKKLLTYNEKHWGPDNKSTLMKKILRATLFESFCGLRFSGAKRFSLEGCEALIPALDTLLTRACANGISAIEMGMAHRGRLNVLHNVFRVPMEALLHRFQAYLPDDGEHPNNSDDVRYHLGTSVLRKFTINGMEKSLRVSLAANPSHLEVVNSVVLGKTRARQYLIRGSLHNEEGLNLIEDNSRRGSVDYSPSDSAKKQVMAVLIHGDASFYQGSVRETLGFHGLRDYNTGGTVHLIVNNQVGFTTTPRESHSSMYCSDVALTIGAPVFHVNLDHPEQVCDVIETAVDYRQNFGRDVVVNLWGYRRHGHNEQDNPELTLPYMYSKIKTHRTLQSLYEEETPWLNHKELENDIKKSFEESLRNLNIKSNKQALMPLWSELGLIYEKEFSRIKSSMHDHKIQTLIRRTITGVDVEVLRSYGRAMFTLPMEGPDKFNFHPFVQGLFAQRLASIQNASESKIKWATAEALAFGSLLCDGYNIRLSGQDVERGTFNQRHAVIYDQEKQSGTTEVYYKPWTALQGQDWHTADVVRILSKRSIDRDDDTEDSEASDKMDVFTPMIRRSDSFTPSHLVKADGKRPTVAAGHYMFPSENEVSLDLTEVPDKTVQAIEVIQQDSQNRASLVRASRKALGWRSPEERHRHIGEMEVCNSPLSEEAVLGFEHGYSLYSPNIMAIWEAQFGDFCNCAQPSIDLFIASGEDKWVRSSGVVLLLPHGYDGQGPDHSTARVERFLQLASEEDCPTPFPRDRDSEMYRLAKVNMHIINPSTPAQYFHALRRHMLLPVRKPLVVFTPKFLLHHAACSSSLEEMGRDRTFETVLDDPITSKKPASVRRIVLCSGKIYYHLMHQRRALQLENEVALIRLEQLCPFPFHSIRVAMSQYLHHGRVDVVWAQEEPKNMGPWAYVEPRLSWSLQHLHVVQYGNISNSGVFNRPIRYIGRPASASPATGSFEYHREQMQRIVNSALQDTSSG